MAENEEWRVVVDLLRKEASRVWGEDTGTVLGRAARNAAGLDLTTLEAGIFGLVIGAYNAATHRVADLAAEGAAEFGEIASALRRNADWYEQTEADTEAEWVHVDEGY